MEEFKKKTVNDMILWLKNETYSERICAIFEENEIDGESFFFLTDENIGDLIKPIGPKRKLQQERNRLMSDSCINKEQMSTTLAVLSDLSSNFDDAYVDDAYVDHLTTNLDMDNDNDESTILDLNNDNTPSQTSAVSDHFLTGNTETDKAGSIPIDQPENSQHFKQTTTTTDTLPPPAKKLKLKSTKKIEKALPQPFPLPNCDNHSKIVMEGLSNDHLIGRARSKFVSEIATSIMFYKNYPSLKEYNDVAKQITIQYPQLKSREGKGHEYLIEALRDKLKYFRNYDGAK